MKPYVDPLLTSVSLAYKNDENSYIAEKLFPIVAVKKDSGKITSYGMDNLREEDALRAKKGSTNEVNSDLEIQAEYSLEEYALKELVADQDEEDADSPIRPRMDAAENLTDRLWVIKEKALADAMVSGNISNNSALGAATQWNNYTSATSDPIGDIQSARNTVRSASGKLANTLAIGYDVFSALLDHPDFIDRFKSGLADKDAIAQAMARILGLRDVLVSHAQYNAGEENEANSLTDIWTDKAVIAYVEAKPRLKTQTFGYTYQKMGENRIIDRWYENDRKGWFIRCTDKFDQEFVNAACGYLYTDVLA